MPRFSPQPGHRERHLLRRLENPLFAPEHRRVSVTEMDTARRQDEAEARRVGEDVRNLFREAANLNPNEESGRILALKEGLDAAYERCAGLGGDQSRVLKGIERLVEVLMRAVRAGAAGDPVAQAELDDEDTARQMHYALLAHPIVADLLRPDSAIGADELVPSLLSEPESGFRAALQLFDADQRRSLYGRARALIEADGVAAGIGPHARANLEVLARSLDPAGRHPH